MALSLLRHLLDGLQNRDRRAQVASLPGVEVQEDSGSQMSDDLRRLRCKGLICRPPRSRRYFLTPRG